MPNMTPVFIESFSMQCHIDICFVLLLGDTVITCRVHSESHGVTDDEPPAFRAVRFDSVEAAREFFEMLKAADELLLSSSNETPQVVE